MLRFWFASVIAIAVLLAFLGWWPRSANTEDARPSLAPIGADPVLATPPEPAPAPEAERPKRSPIDSPPPESTFDTPTLRQENPFSIRGSVRNDLGTPIARFTIETCPYVGDEELDRVPAEDLIATARATAHGRKTWGPPAEPSGRFELQGFSPGTYIVTVRSHGHAPSALPSRVGPIDEQLDVVLPRCARLQGSVVEANGHGVPKAVVFHRLDSRWPESVETDENGAFLFENVNPGKIRLSAWTQRGMVDGIFVRFSTQEPHLVVAEETVVELDPGQSRQVELVLVEAVELIVRCPDEKGPTGVEILDPQGRPRLALWENLLRGTFALLPPGTYTVRANDWKGNEASRIVELGDAASAVVELHLE